MGGGAAGKIFISLLLHVGGESVGKTIRYPVAVCVIPFNLIRNMTIF